MFAKRNKHYPSRSRQTGLATAVTNITKLVTKNNFGPSTAVSSEGMAKLRDWAVWQARTGCYSQAALSSNDSKTL